MSRRRIDTLTFRQDLRADRETRPEIREVPFHASGLSRTAGAPLTAWRGLSNTCYACAVYPADCSLAADLYGPAVLLAVARDAQGVASPLRAGCVTPETFPAALAAARALGANELHLHRLADTVAARRAAIADLTPVAQAEAA